MLIDDVNTLADLIEARMLIRKRPIRCFRTPLRLPDRGTDPTRPARMRRPNGSVSQIDFIPVTRDAQFHVWTLQHPVRGYVSVVIGRRRIADGNIRVERKRVGDVRFKLSDIDDVIGIGGLRHA
jgi:hypothetical protein